MTKYYKVIKDNPLWEIDAILGKTADEGRGYDAIEDIWNRLEDQNEYLTANIVENNPDFFQRVYKSEGEKLVFLTAEQLKKAYKKFRP